MSEPLLSYFYCASLWLWELLWEEHTLKVYVPSSLSVRSQKPWRNLRIIVSPQGLFFCKNSFYDSTDCQNLWCCWSISPKTILIPTKNFLNFWLNAFEGQSFINLNRYGSKCLPVRIWTPIDLMRENSFTLKKKKGKKQTIPHRNYYACKLRFFKCTYLSRIPAA